MHPNPGVGGREGSLRRASSSLDSILWAQFGGVGSRCPGWRAIVVSDVCSAACALQAGLRALIGHHHLLSTCKKENGSGGQAELELQRVCDAIVMVLSASMASAERFKQILPEWLTHDGAASPAQALASAASEVCNMPSARCLTATIRGLRPFRGDDVIPS